MGLQANQTAFHRGDKMMKIKNGKVFYRLVIEKDKFIGEQLIAFCCAKKVQWSEIDKLKAIDFNLSGVTVIQMEGVQMDINVKPSEIILLFTTIMTTDNFNEFTKGFFE